ncbi:MAG: winged helix DNA-binding domain-containing protein, partial [Propionibacteriales bacterium]|nr:winged helix DNA-binding domain-containing protein [Propionibacteriales bacterium]
ALRPAVQIVLDRGLASTYGTRLGGADLDDLARDARTLVEERPRTPNEVGTILQERWPDADVHGLGVAARTRVPMVQVPPRGLWGQSGPAAHTTVETWLGRSCGPSMPLETLVLRYLRAFGPASVMDVQKWCGLTKLGAVVKRMGDQLRRFESTDGRPLFDLPHAPRPGGDLPVPPRFVADFDNLLLSHADRTRVLADVHKDHVFPVNGVIPRTVLVDGFVAATWKVTQEKSTAVLTVRPFERLPRAEVDGVLAEGERLLAWMVDDADERDVRIAT